MVWVSAKTNADGVLQLKLKKGKHTFYENGLKKRVAKFTTPINVTRKKVQIYKKRNRKFLLIRVSILCFFYFINLRVWLLPSSKLTFTKYNPFAISAVETWASRFSFIKLMVCLMTTFPLGSMTSQSAE